MAWGVLVHNCVTAGYANSEFDLLVPMGDMPADDPNVAPGDEIRGSMLLQPKTKPKKPW